MSGEKYLIIISNYLGKYPYEFGTAVQWIAYVESEQARAELTKSEGIWQKKI